MCGTRAFDSTVSVISRWALAVIITLFCTLALAPARAQTDDGEAACQRESETRNRFGASEEALPYAEACAEAVKQRVGAEHPDYGVALYNLTDLLTTPSLKRGAEAVALNQTARAIFEKAAANEPSNSVWPRYLIKTRERLVMAGDDSRANMEIALTTVRRMEANKQLAPWEKDWPDDIERDLLRVVAVQLAKANQFEDALSMAERLAKNIEQNEAGESPSREATARALNGVAWYALLAHQPQKALAASEKAISLAPDKAWIAINRAHALMFLGDAEGARAAYLKHKGANVHDPLGAANSLTPKRSSSDKWEIAIAWDFFQFRQHGLDHAQMAEIETALRVTDSPLVVLRQARELIAEGKTAEALTLHQGYMEKVKARFGEISIQHASLLQNFALRLPDLNRSDMAEEVTKHALAITEELVKKGNEQDGSSPKAAAIDELKLVEPLLMLAGVYERQERLAEAEPLAARALELCEKTAKADQEVLSCLTRASEALLHVYAKNNQQAEAEQMLQRIVSVGEKKWGASHPNTARLLQALGSISTPGERAKVEERGADILSNALKSGHPDAEFEAVARDPGFADLANRFINKEQFDEAERTLKLVIKHTGSAPTCDALMDLYKTRKKFSEIEAFYKTLVMDEDRYKSALGCAGRQIDAYLGAEKYYQERQNSAQVQFYQRLIIKARERRLYNWNHEWTKSFVGDLDQLAKLYTQQNRHADAKTAMERAQDLTPKQAYFQKQEPAAKDDTSKNQPTTGAYFKDTYLAMKGDGQHGEELIDKAFVMAQRERRTADGPEPLTVAQTQASLRPDEAVVLYLATSENNLDAVYIWAITKAQTKWERVEFGGGPSNESLQSRVSRLRCGLDPANWAAGSESRGTCERQREAETQEKLFLLAVKDPAGDRAALRHKDESQRLDWFDAERAYDLYGMLFGPIRDVIGDKQLLITADGPLTRLPFDALVTGKPKTGDALADAHWLARRQSVSVLPSAARRRSGGPLLNAPIGEKLQSCAAKAQSHASGASSELCAMAQNLNADWAADPDAAVAIAAGAASALKAEPSVGRSEALRRAKLALIDKGGKMTHPYFWAPFALTGEDQR